MSAQWSEQRFLDVMLTPAEVQARGEQLAKAVEDAAALEVTHKHMRDHMREDLANLEGQVARLATVIRRGVEERSVEVRCMLNVSLALVEEYRVDTGECIRSRPATKEDALRAQMKIPGTEPPP